MIGLKRIFYLTILNYTVKTYMQTCSTNVDDIEDVRGCHCPKKIKNHSHIEAPATLRRIKGAILSNYGI